jgi:hypothetical protein
MAGHASDQGVSRGIWLGLFGRSGAPPAARAEPEWVPALRRQWQRLYPELELDGLSFEEMRAAIADADAGHPESPGKDARWVGMIGTPRFDRQ